MSKDTRGMFTGKDLAYLRGQESNLAERTEYNRRRQIRDRLVAGMIDLETAYLELPENDRQKIRENHTDELVRGLQSLTALGHELLTDDKLLITLQDGISRAAKKADPSIYNTTLEKWDHDRRPLEHNITQIQERYETHGEDALSDTELGRLAREGLLDD